MLVWKKPKFEILYAILGVYVFACSCGMCSLLFLFVCFWGLHLFASSSDSITTFSLTFIAKLKRDRLTGWADWFEMKDASALYRFYASNLQVSFTVMKKKINWVVADVIPAAYHITKPCCQVNIHFALVIFPVQDKWKSVYIDAITL